MNMTAVMSGLIPKSTNIQLGIAFGAGILLGSLVTYFSSRKKFETSAQDEIDEMRHFYMKKVDEARQEAEEAEDPEPSELDVATAKNLRDARAMIIDKGYAEVIVEADENEEPYSIISRAEAKESDPELLEFDEEGEVAALLAKGNEAPYIISYEEWCDADEHEPCDKTSISWYEQDTTMADDREDPIDDWDTLIGRDNLQWFGWRSYDENVVYVMNNDISTAFEVTRVPGAYSIVVLGDPDFYPQPKPEIRKMRRDE